MTISKGIRLGADTVISNRAYTQVAYLMLMVTSIEGIIGHSCITNKGIIFYLLCKAASGGFYVWCHKYRARQWMRNVIISVEATKEHA